VGVQAGEGVRTKGGGGLLEDTAPALAPGMPSPAEQPTSAGAERLHDLFLKANKEADLVHQGKTTQNR